ncbi:MAG: hypothetical protein M3P28_03920 [Thermoproteota archaeon]|nr:hypothetical protein [Thermoproteota archaeon]
MSKQEYILGVIVENNPFYGMSNEKINSIESTTIDNFIRVKLEYSPNLVDPNSPEFFKFTLTYTDTNEKTIIGSSYIREEIISIQRII